MSLKKRGEYYYGDSKVDIREELLRFSTLNGYAIHHFADAICTCGDKLFALQLDDAVGAAVRTCVACKKEHPIGDSEDYLDDAELEERECVCGKDVFEITVGVSLYEGSADVRWLYVGCRCPACGLTGSYGDWKNEYLGYQELLRRV